MTSSTTRRRVRTAGAVVALVAVAAAGTRLDDDGRMDADDPFAGEDLVAYGFMSYPPGTTFSYSLTRVDTSVSGRLTDLSVEIRGDGLRFEGFAVTRPGTYGFDVAEHFPPERRALRGAVPAEGATVVAGEIGVQLMVGLTVTDGSWSQALRLRYTVVDEDGVEHEHVSPVGVTQCREVPGADHTCPEGWSGTRIPV